jgi:Calcium binding
VARLRRPTTYYLDGKMSVPFKARSRLARPISVLKVKEEVEVLGMAPEEECETEMFV